MKKARLSLRELVYLYHDRRLFEKRMGCRCDLREELGRPFDFMRVDLYSIDGRIRFGERTAYPGSGYYPYPREMDELLGSCWQLPRLE